MTDELVYTFRDKEQRDNDTPILNSSRPVQGRASAHVKAPDVDKKYVKLNLMTKGNSRRLVTCRLELLVELTPTPSNTSLVAAFLLRCCPGSNRHHQGR